MEEPPPPVRTAPDSVRSEASAPPKRLSVSYSAQELGSPRHESRGSRAELLVERKAASKLGLMADTLGSHTRHGVVPGPSGSAYAKINQDRGAVFWPFNDSHNEALLCVFDGHGVAGEKVAEVCIKSIPAVLQERGVQLRPDPIAVLTRTVLDTEEDVSRQPRGGSREGGAGDGDGRRCTERKDGGRRMSAGRGREMDGEDLRGRSVARRRAVQAGGVVQEEGAIQEGGAMQRQVTSIRSAL
jgi:hypothetical protein